jgi:phenylalanyl-tRNA synthetase alpha chain
MSQPSKVPVPEVSVHEPVVHPGAPRDLTDPAEGPHAVQKVMDAAVRALAGAWRCEVVLHRASPVIPLADSAARLAGAPPAGLLVVRPVVVARDGAPGERWHRLDLWCIRRGPRLGLKALAEMIGLAARAVAPGLTLSAVPSADPHFVDGRQLDVRVRGAWTGIGKGGLVPPALLADLGLPDDASALALTLDLDRLVMLAKGMDDAVLLRSEDPRVAAQMLDLSPYVPAAMEPDAGVAVPAALDAVRASIDEVDGRIVKLLSKRRAFALLAGRLKRPQGEIRAPAREEQVVARVRALAHEAGIEPDLVEGLYRHLIDEFVRLQRDAQRSGAGA